MRLFRRSVVAILAVSLLMAACGNDNKKSSSTAKGTLTIGSANFPESELIANIYAAALRAKGYEVNVRGKLGTREITQPALEKGEINIMPEYVGTLLTYYKGTPTGDLDKTVADLRIALKTKRLQALDPAEAYDTNALVVTKATADKYKLTKTSDLAAVAGELTLGGPPECPTRPLCAVGYKDKYGIAFKSFKPLDTGGPITKKALTDGGIDVAVLFSSDVPANSVVLADDKGLQAVDNIIPVGGENELTGEVSAALNAVSKKLSLDDLVELNQKIGAADKPDLSVVADEWAKGYGLA